MILENPLENLRAPSKFCEQLVGYMEILFRGTTGEYLHVQHVQAQSMQVALNIFEREHPAVTPIGIRDASWRGDSFTPVVLNTNKYSVKH